MIDHLTFMRTAPYQEKQRRNKMSLTKEEIKEIEKVIDQKTAKAFLIILDKIGRANLSIPNIRAYVQEKISKNKGE